MNVNDRTHWEAREDLWDALCNLMDAVHAFTPYPDDDLGAAMVRAEEALNRASMDSPPNTLGGDRIEEE